jgi:hypothetical protein
MTRRVTPNLLGRTFGRLTVKERAPQEKYSKPQWICICSCGTERTFFADNLKNGKSLSCGCLRGEMIGNRSRTHGKRRSPEYTSWVGMRFRCGNPNDPGFQNYGGRGISVCERWLSSFEAFYEDMGPRPSDKYSIDRINNDGNYEPGNCRWATDLEQVRNTRSNVAATIHGERVLLTDAARRLGMTTGSVSERIARGWSIEKAFTEPKNG